MKFNNLVQLRLSDEQLLLVDEVVRDNAGVFVSRSHFIRSAIIEKLRNYRGEK